MNTLGLLFSLIAASLLLALPRRWAPLPLLLGATYIPMGQEIAIGPFTFTVVRLLVALGFLRVLIKGEHPVGGLRRLDWIMILWAFTLVGTSVFHRDLSATLVYRFGLAYDALGVFLLFRVFLQEPEDLRLLFKIVCILLTPVAVSMLAEKFTGENYFSLLFGGEATEFRNGSFRARGPFVHAILAGTIGAVCLPMAVYLWSEQRKIALLGVFASCVIVFASGSSGPILTALTVIATIALWKIHYHLRPICWFAVLLIIALDLVMKDPVYFLMARIDITGGSTGYFRAQLIRSAIEHFNEWWLIGTDYTRHWMPSGITANAFHTDITNHYIAMGVMGGMPLFLVFFWVLIESFAIVGRAFRLCQGAPPREQFLLWMLGCILFAHATTFLSISYFGQAVLFLYLLLGSIGSLQAMWPAYAEDYGDEQANVLADTGLTRSA